MTTKKCVICGQEFTTNINSKKLCDCDHKVKCSICGNEFISRDIDLLRKYKSGEIVTCSNRECRYEARKKRSLIKYGVESHLQLPSIRSKIYESYINNKVPNSLSKYRDMDNIREVSTEELTSKLRSLLDDNNINYKSNVTLDNYTYSFIINDSIVLNIIDYPALYNELCMRSYPKELKSTALKYYDRYIAVYNWDDLNKIVYLVKDKSKLYARQCEVREVDVKECSNFLNTYHIQGTCRYQSIRIGLYYENELVQIMTFGKPRYNKQYQYELLRLCTKAEYKVVGGSERLLKYFIDKYRPSSIVSYCDSSKFSGEVYEILGFKYLYTTSSRRHWNKGETHITDNLLYQHGYDHIFGTSYGKGFSNSELMRMNGWKEVFDCGQSTYVISF